MAKNVTAFVLDPDHVQSSADGMTVPPLPGIWHNDVAIHPEALGLSLAEMRDLVEKLSLPLVEKSVPESKALSAFPVSEYLLPSGPNRLGGDPNVPPEVSSTDEVAPGDVDVDRAKLAAEETDDNEGDN